MLRVHLSKGHLSSYKSAPSDRAADTVRDRERGGEKGGERKRFGFISILQGNRGARREREDVS